LPNQLIMHGVMHFLDYLYPLISYFDTNNVGRWCF